MDLSTPFAGSPETINCPYCGKTIPKASTFCLHCGKQLQEPLPSGLKQVFYYAVSFFLPPTGLWWGIKYLRSPNEALKKIGAVCIILTFASLIITVWTFNTLLTSLTAQINSQMGSLGGLSY